MIIGNKEKYKGKGIICFIDILGFSNDIFNHWDNQKNNPLNKILDIKKNLPVINPNNYSITPKNQEIREYACRINSVSDSITICFGHDEPSEYYDNYLGLLVLLISAFKIWKSAIYSGYTVRGGIDYGDIYWDKNDLIGPSFINAYLLESKIAKTSRILVSSDLNKMMKQVTETFSDKYKTIMLDFFQKDIDGYLILNPQKLIDEEKERDELIAILTKLKGDTKNTILKEKYTSLIYRLFNKTNNKLTYEDLANY